MNTPRKDLIIAIDGYSSCGKSTLAKDVANELTYTYIDSGAMYRTVTLFCLRNNFITGDQLLLDKILSNLKNISISFTYNNQTGQQETLLNGENVENEIRKPVVASSVSQISTIAEVRSMLVKMQQSMGKKKRIVMDGRDIGTVVFPKADLKLFMTADPLVRAQRRLLELDSKGIKTSIEEVLENLKQRDFIDETRNESPLRKADDAIVLDNSRLSRSEQLLFVLQLIEKL